MKGIVIMILIIATVLTIGSVHALSNEGAGNVTDVAINLTEHANNETQNMLNVTEIANNVTDHKNVTNETAVESNGKGNGRMLTINEIRKPSNNASVRSSSIAKLSTSEAREGNTVNSLTVNNETLIHIKFSNGHESDVKIMPDTASQTAIARLGLKVCSTQNNCTIQLKEVGKGNDTSVDYEVRAIKEAKLFGFLKTNMTVQADIDANTGNVTGEHRPWWAALTT